MHGLFICRDRGQERGEEKTAGEKMQSKDMGLKETCHTWEHRQLNIVGMQKCDN